MEQRHPVSASRPLDPSSALPLWAQLRGDLVRPRAAPEFTAGLPGEQP